MINLKSLCKEYFPKEWKLPFSEYKKQRAKFGVSEFDIDFAGDYLDEVIYNTLEMLINESTFGPTNMTQEEWKNYLTQICDVFKAIVVNNEILANLTVDEMYEEQTEALLAENYAYRTEAMTMLLEVWDFLHTF